jgi:hypothetical protein
LELRGRPYGWSCVADCAQRPRHLSWSCASCVAGNAAGIGFREGGGARRARVSRTALPTAAAVGSAVREARARRAPPPLEWNLPNGSTASPKMSRLWVLLGRPVRKRGGSAALHLPAPCGNVHKLDILTGGAGVGNNWSCVAARMGGAAWPIALNVAGTCRLQLRFLCGRESC